MSMPSIDTYLKSTLDSSLRLLFKNPVLLTSLLKDLEPESSKNFIDYYTDPAHELPVVFAYPSEPNLLFGFIMISLLNGEENQDSIGSAIGEYSFNEGNASIEQVSVQIDTNSTDPLYQNKMYLEVSQEVGYVESVEDITFDSTEPWINGSRVYFNYSEDAVGGSFIVHYIPVSQTGVLTGQEHNSGLVKGYEAEESYGIACQSTNMDIVRCADALVKALLITMRSSIDEQYTFSLQKITYGDIEPVDPYGADSGQLVFGRQISVTYKVPYSLDVQDKDALTNIVVKGRMGDNGQPYTIEVK